MFGTDVGYGTAMSGTDVGYGTAMSGGPYRMSGPGLCCAIVLRARYGMSGTGKSYGVAMCGTGIVTYIALPVLYHDLES
eukprot:489516-Rhodomonas_salina.1